MSRSQYSENGDYANYLRQADFEKTYDNRIGHKNRIAFFKPMGVIVRDGEL